MNDKQLIELTQLRDVSIGLVAISVVHISFQARVQSFIGKIPLSAVILDTPTRWRRNGSNRGETLPSNLS